MEWIDRYIYAVVRRLPEKQREDIERELRTLIEDMLAQRAEETGSGNTEENIRAVLGELGNPADLAAKYSGRPNVLIGPELFETYKMVLKIALAASAFGILVATIVNYAVTPPASLAGVFGTVIGSAFSAVIQAFAWVTIVFALIDRFATDRGKFKKHDWQLSDLPEIPVKDITIKKSEPIVGIVFIVIFYILLNFAPELFAVYHAGAKPITVFNLAVLQSLMPLVNIGLAIGAVKEMLRLVSGRYTARLAVATMVLDLLALIFWVIVFSHFYIWNMGFVVSIDAAYHLSLPVGYDYTLPVMIFAKVFLGILVFSFAAQTIRTIFIVSKSGLSDFKRFFI